MTSFNHIYHISGRFVSCKLTRLVLDGIKFVFQEIVANSFVAWSVRILDQDLTTVGYESRFTLLGKDSVSMANISIIIFCIVLSG